MYSLAAVQDSSCITRLNDMVQLSVRLGPGIGPDRNQWDTEPPPFRSSRGSYYLLFVVLVKFMEQNPEAAFLGLGRPTRPSLPLFGTVSEPSRASDGCRVVSSGTDCLLTTEMKRVQGKGKRTAQV